MLYASWGPGGLEGVRIGVASLKTRTARILDLAGTYAYGVVDGWLVYNNSAGALLAAPVDLGAGKVTGAPVTLTTGLLVGSGGIARAALSQAGTLAFVQGSRESVLGVASANGAVVPVFPEARLYGYPRYSPDGKRITYSLGTGTRTDVWVYDFASRTPIRLTTGGSVNERPEWTPDGRRVVYRSDQGTLRSIWAVPTDLSGPAEPLIATPRDVVFEAVISPDGKYIVFQEDTVGADIWYRALSPDSAARPVATTRFIENMARVSPDGRWVVFVSDESGASQVVVQPFPGPGPRMQVSTAGGTEPVWARDGRRLFYRANQKIMVATVSTTPGLDRRLSSRAQGIFSVTARGVFSNDDFMLAQSPHANYDVAPDGQHLLVLKGQLDPRLLIVHNWVRELRERVARVARP